MSVCVSIPFIIACDYTLRDLVYVKFISRTHLYIFIFAVWNMLAPAGFVCGICVRTYIVDLCVAMAGRAKTYQSTKCYIIFGSYLTYVTTKTTFRVCCGADKERKSISMFSLLWFALFTVHTTAPCNQFFANVRSQFTLTRRASHGNGFMPSFFTASHNSRQAQFMNCACAHIKFTLEWECEWEKSRMKSEMEKERKKKKRHTHILTDMCV